MSVPSLPLVGGNFLPLVGFGTAGGSKEEMKTALNKAMECGYRHIDTAYNYGSEEPVGEVVNDWIKSGRVRREDLFIVTKLPPMANTPDRVEEYLKTSLDRLKLNYVDLYLIHFPVWHESKDPTVLRGGERIVHPTDHIALWKKLEEQVDAGRTKAIGLSNFNVRQIDRILKSARIKPACLQIRVNVYLQDDELIKFAQDNGIAVVAYSPLGNPGRGPIGGNNQPPVNVVQMIDDPTVVKIAQKHNRSPGQILLKFLTQRNIAVIPKSFNPSRIQQNINLFDFSLDEDDMNQLLGLNRGEKSRSISYYPENVRNHPEFPWPKKE